MQTLDELLRLPHPQALLAAGNSARIASAANAEELCARSYAERYGDAGTSLRYAELAVVLARRSGSDQVRGRALAYLGNALRLLGRHFDAGVALDEADALLGEDDSFRHRLLGFRSSHAESIRDWPSARNHLRKRLDLSASIPERATTLIKTAIVELHDKSPLIAFQNAVAAVRTLQLERPANVELMRYAIQTTANVVLELGDPVTALEIFAPYYQRLWAAAPHAERLKARWLHARLLFAHGARDAGLMELREVRDAYSAADRRIEAAWTAVDLAMMQTAAGDIEAARICAAEALALFEAFSLKVDASAVRLLLDAIEAGDGRDPRFQEVVELLHSSATIPA